MNKKVVDNYE